jgi:Holliday junction resolvase RusA-like endonuclease
MPKSWSRVKRREMLGKGHTTPKGKSKDLDNLKKALNDALRPGDDGNIWHQSGVKTWANQGGIEVIIYSRWDT